MAPSVEKLSAAFPKLTRDQIREIREHMHRAESADYWSGFSKRREAMQAIDRILGTHGVEGISKGRNSRSPAIAYCNTGDTYGVTVLLVNDRFRVGSWGDIVERGNYD